MNEPTTLTLLVDFHRAARGQRQLQSRPDTAAAPQPGGRVPRVARLMALALRLDGQVRAGMLPNYSTLARVGHVTRARVSQIMNLIHLAPDLQEALLFLPRTGRGRDSIHLRLLQPIALTADWQRQRRLWQALLATRQRATA